MRPTDNIEKLIQKLRYDASAETHDRILGNVMQALGKVEKEKQVTLAPPVRDGQVQNIWRTIMKSKITKLAAAAVVIVAVLISIHQFGGPFVTGTPMFAQVIQSILDAQTATLTIIIGEEGKGAEIHDMIMGSRIRRTLPSIEGLVAIIDLESGRILQLTPDKKEAIYIDLKDWPSIPNYMERLQNSITMLQDSPNFVVEELGLQQVQGQELIGFHAKHPKTDITIWADPDTALPVRIEQIEGQMQVICKDLQFDVPMDEALFSMDVPEGYTLHETELDLHGATEQDFIEGLRLMAEVFGNGYFPDSVAVEDYIKEAPNVAKKIEEIGLSEEEQIELGMKLQQYLLFIRFFKGEGKWHYVGKGVKLGDADTPIFWYRPKDSETYRVIYGDLSVEDVAPEDLPEPISKEKTAKVSLGYQQWSDPDFVGTQEDMCYITASGDIVVHSHINLRKGPEDTAILPVELPYTSGTVASVTLNETTVEFHKVDDGKYELELTLDEILDGQTAITCIWTFSLSALTKTDSGYEVKLQSLIPVVYYKLTYVLEPDCDYEFTQDPNQRWIVPFFGDSTSPKTNFGGSALLIRKSN